MRDEVSEALENEALLFKVVNAILRS